MANSKDVLNAVNHLSTKLYGENGFEGDIPEIKKLLDGYDKRISRNSRLLFTALGILSASGLGFGMISWLG